MEGQGAQAQRVQTSAEVNSPNLNYAIIFRDNSDGMYYAKLSSGVVEPLGSSTGNGDWKFNGNVVLAEKSIGTLDAFDFPFIVNGVEGGRFKVGGDFQLNFNILSSTGAISIKPSSRELTNLLGVTTLSWNNGRLFDGAGILSMDWFLRTLSDSAGVISENYNTRELFDSTGVASINWESKSATSTSGAQSINWETRTLFDSASIASLDWENRTLNSSAGIAFVYWANENLGINIAVPTSKLHTKGTGITGATSSFRAENSTDTSFLVFKDNGELNIVSTLDGTGSGLPNVSFTSTTGGVLHTYNSTAGQATQIDFYETAVIKARIQEGAGGIYTIAATNRIAWKDLTTNFTKVWVEMASSFVGIGLDFFVTSALLHLRGLGATGATYSVKVENSTPALLFGIKDDGNISMPLVQTGNAGLVAGDLYADTAANILGNGDQVIGRKV